MADQNPTDDGPAVMLTIPACDESFLRRVFTMALDGLREELAGFSDQLRHPARLLREEAAYGKLLDALTSGKVYPDRDLGDVLADLATVIDNDNEYGRVVAEHRALHGLMDQIPGALS